jgi:hypothetical protein
MFEIAVNLRGMVVNFDGVPKMSLGLITRYLQMAAVSGVETTRNDDMESPYGTAFCLFMSHLKGLSRHGFAASRLIFVGDWSRPVRRFFVRHI